MDSCCKNTYDNQFSAKLAESEYRDYLKNGPKKTTKYLLEQVMRHDLKGASLLDIGGGVGAIVWELWNEGVEKAYYQEISDAYAQAFQQEVGKRGLQEVITIKVGDFVEDQSWFPQVDVVTLDKVICCYEDFRSLVRESVAKARKIYAYTLPQEVWWVKAAVAVENFFKRWIGNKMVTWVHPVKEVEALVGKAGFQKVYEEQHREWLTVVFEKT